MERANVKMKSAASLEVKSALPFYTAQYTKGLVADILNTATVCQHINEVNKFKKIASENIG